MSTARAYGRAITIGDYIYVVGGNAASGISALVERYDPAANTWTAAPSMPTARADADAFAVGDYLYVTGGISSFVLPWTPTNAVERYYLPNFPGGAWETMPAAPEAFGGAAFGCANDRMWSIGGAGPNTTFYTTNRWNDEGLPCSSCAPGLVWMDIPWVTEVPTNGVVPPDTAFDVDVTFDTTGLTVGECYTGSLGLLHDDPGWASPFFIPLMLCVEEACEEVAGVELSVVSPGPFYPGATVEFSADIAPDGFTGPYNYSINGGPVQVSGDDPLLFSLTFTEPGTQTVEIAVWNCDMSAPATDTVEVIVNYYTTYLPMILKNY